MQQTATDIYTQFQGETASITPFAQARMGLKSGQTAIKLDTYNIVCVPYRLSMNKAVLIASFSREELAFFQRYVNGLAGLTLIFQPGNSPNPLKIFARSMVGSISAMAGRESVGLIEMVFKPIPPDLLTILGEYFMLLDRLKVEFEDFKAKPVPINPDNAKLMGYNNYAVLIYEKIEAKIALFALTSDSLDFLVPLNGPVLEQGKPVQLKLFFQRYQFSVPGIIASVNKLPNGVQKAKATIQFSPELVAIIEDFRFAERFPAKGPQPGSVSRAEPTR